jgi:hypothetical protein
VSPGQRIEGYDGVAFSLKADGFQMAAVYLKQTTPEREMWFYLTLPVNPGVWVDYNIPFAAFEPSDPGDRLDPAQAVVMEIGIPYDENWYAYSFRTGTEIACDLSLDNVGYYRLKSPDDPRVVATFDDEVDRMPWSAYLYGISIYTDYRFSDGGEEKLNPGVSGQTILLTKAQPGAPGTGRHLSVEARVDLTGRIGSYFDDEAGITLFLSTPLVSHPEGFDALTFFVKSTIATRGRLELNDWANERGYAFEFPVSGFWTRVRVPFAEWEGEHGSLADSLAAGLAPVPGRTRLLLGFDLPEDPFLGAGTGPLIFLVGLDDFVWED